MKKYLQLIVIGLSFGTSLAQEGLKIRYEQSLHGDISVIGNTIVNRKTLFSNSNKAYNDRQEKAKKNEQFVMKYINIDENSVNFSSSSAFLTLNTNEKLTLQYAGLYWVATYPYTEGKLMGKERFVPVKHSKENFDAVRIKLPQSNQYQTIVGQVIYTGESLENEPYMVYADITELLQKHSQWQGEYFVANIRSATGKVKGGICGGWTIVFVYEKQNEPLKKIISYDGFLPIKGQTNVVFQGFKTPDNENVMAKIIGASLGVDTDSQNSLAIQTPGNDSFVLQTDIRSATQFLNSSITDNHQYVYNRKPSSLNTLGFDIFSVDIDNQQNAVIPNKSSSITLDMNSTQEMAYLFMTALAVSQTKEPSEFQIKPEIIHTIQSVASEQEIKTKKEEKTPYQENDSTDVRQEQSIQYHSIEGQESGYYVILGVFSLVENVENLIADLRENDILASYFFDEKKKLYYVYESHNQTYHQAQKRREKIRVMIGDDSYFKDLKQAWILGINLSISSK